MKGFEIDMNQIACSVHKDCPDDRLCGKECVVYEAHERFCFMQRSYRTCCNGNLKSMLRNCDSVALKNVGVSSLY